MAPLLIGVKVTYKSNQQIDFLNSLKIEASKISEESAIIRSLPSFLLKINFNLFLEKIASNYKEDLDIEEIIKTLPLLIQNHQINFIHQFLEEDGLSTKYLKILKEDDLEKLF